MRGLAHDCGIYVHATPAGDVGRHQHGYAALALDAADRVRDLIRIGLQAVHDPRDAEPARALANVAGERCQSPRRRLPSPQDGEIS